MKLFNLRIQMLAFCMIDCSFRCLQYEKRKCKLHDVRVLVVVKVYLLMTSFFPQLIRSRLEELDCQTQAIDAHMARLVGVTPVKEDEVCLCS